MQSISVRTARTDKIRPCCSYTARRNKGSFKTAVAATPQNNPADVNEFEGFDPSRHMPLPNNAMWLLDYLQDQWYDVRGPTFVIQRAEHVMDGGAAMKARKVKQVAPVAKDRTMGLVHKVIRQFPGSIMLLEGGVVDVSDLLMDIEAEEAATFDAPGVPVTANPTCTGIVWMPKEEEETQEDSAEVFFTNSTSPRRTKVIGFTCKCCGARNHSRINPQSFLQGTLVAQCASCERWHKIADHFGLFHSFKGPVFRSKPDVTLDDIPPSLRPQDPELWGKPFHPHPEMRDE